MSRTRPIALVFTLGLLVAGGRIVPSVQAGGQPVPETLPDPALRLDTSPEGRSVRLAELGEGPFVVVPIFTRCRAVCGLVTRSLKTAWENAAGRSDEPGTIVLVSFDPEDTPADMARFREAFAIPPAWRLATLEREEGLRFFSALGFQWRTLGRGQFDHSGKIFVLTAERRVAAVLGPNELTAQRLSSEIRAARTGVFRSRRLGSHFVGFFGVGAILLFLLAAVTWDRVRSRRPYATAS